jgi:hypothetical protein
MTVMLFLQSLILTLILSALAACAHSYYYLPEIGGEGATHGKKGGIIYTIPSKGQAELTMRARSLGIRKIHNVQMLGMRLSFVRPAGVAMNTPETPETQEYVDPAEQIVRLGGGQEFKPAYVHSKTRKQSIIELSGSAHEVIEFLYPLSQESEGAAQINSYLFQWKVHYGHGQAEQQIARFDRNDAAPQQAAELYPEDADYPYDFSPIDVPGWQIVRDPFWWPLDPWWPWR